MRERHARYYLALTEAAEPELLGPRPLACLERLEVEHGNLRAALGWYLAEDAETEEHAEMGLRLAASLGRFWNTYGPDEGRRWLEKGLVRSGASPTPLRARALSQAGFIAIFQGDPGAMSLLEEGLALSRELGDQSGLAISISTLGHAVAHSGDHERLRALRDEAGTLLLEPLDRRARAHLLLFLAVAALSEGDHGRLEARTDETLILFRELEDIRHVAMSLGVAGISALEQGDPVRAAELFEEDLRLLRELRDKTGIVYGLLGMAGVAALRGQSAHAARLWAASEVLREVIGLPPPSHPWSATTTTTRATFPPRAPGWARRPSRQRGPRDAPCPPSGPSSTRWARKSRLRSLRSRRRRLRPEDRRPPLTPRQREVALLVARGLTNRQTAAELALSEHTVATHLREILKRLGLRSMTELAAWVTERDPLSD